MKKVSASTESKVGIGTHQPHTADGTFSVVHAGKGAVVSQEEKGNGRKAEETTSAPAIIAYDAEDVEEANRIGAALVRQHAK